MDVTPRAIAPACDRLATKEAAAYMGYSESWLNQARAQGKGPRFVRLGAKVFYRQADLDEYVNNSVVETEDSRRANGRA